MNVHPTELALESLPRVPLHNLGADVAGGDVLVGVLLELVRGLQDRRRTHSSGGLHPRPYWSFASSSLHVLEGVHPLALELPCDLLTEKHGVISGYHGTALTSLPLKGLLSNYLPVVSPSCRTNVSKQSTKPVQ